MILNNDAKELISIIKNNGYQAYAVGGCVRDALMNRECGDFDITTSALPNELEDVLDRYNIKYIETGLKHGTVTAIYNSVPYEITTFRSDGEYRDNRHPDSVTFEKDVKLDLARRDFTINAIAYNDEDGFVDCFDGINDINNKIVRCVGDAQLRFNEDALRIMRAVRFASVLCCNIEQETKEAMFNNKHLLKNVASERIYKELIKLLLGDNVENVLIEYREILEEVIPELKCIGDYSNAVKSIGFIEKKDYMRLTSLLLPFDIDESQRVLKHLKVSNDVYNKVTTLIKIHDETILPNKSNIKYWLRTIGIDLTYDFINLKKALNLNLDNKAFEQTKALIDEIIANNEPYLISHLMINGNDLLDLGFEGKSIANELGNLIQLVSTNPEYNEKRKLIEQAKTDLGKI